MRKIVLSVLSILMVCFQLSAQSQRVTGTVTDAATNEALISATIVVKGTDTATLTGLSGEYSINVPVGGTLVFTYQGYADQEIPVAAGQTSLDVRMLEVAEEIETVVVFGYGSARNVGSVTGNVAVVSAEILNDKPVMNAAEALAGQVSGMSVMTSSGEPSQSSSIRIHGSGSLSASTAPLYIIDGMPSSANQFLALSSNDIESMVTLKDASATSIYGSRAANGVIYITTKKGRRHQDASFRFSGSYGLATPVNNRIEFMGADDLLKWQRYFGEITPGDEMEYRRLMGKYGESDWFKYIFKTAATYNAEFSVSGGSEKIGYYMSGSYMNQDGMAPRSGMERFTFRTNLSAQANDWIRIDLSLAGSADIRQTTQGTRVGNALNASSVTNFPVYQPSYMTEYHDEFGTSLEDIKYIQFPNGMYDPYYVVGKGPSEGRNHLINGNVAIHITPVRGLTITSLNGIDANYSTGYYNLLPSHYAYEDSGERDRTFSQYYTLNTSNTVEYKFKPIKDKHNITVLVGQEGIEGRSDGFSVYSRNQTDDRLMLLQKGTYANINYMSESNSSFNMLSFFGRVNYDYQRKYSFDFTLRNDASSKFGKDNRNATFYAVGAMWNIKQESFLAKNKTITDLKLRATFGTQGNSEIGYYSHLALMGAGTDYNESVGKYFASVGNQSLGWESQSKLNIGLEIGLWNRVSLGLNYYNRRTSDMLYTVPYPPSSGITGRTENVLEMVNRGIDIDLGVLIYQNHDWSVNFNAVFGYNKNEITKLYGDIEEIPIPAYHWIYKLGYSSSVVYSPVFMGVDPYDGKPMYDDGNGNPVKDTNLAAYVVTDYDFVAPINGGFSFDARWKGLSLQANFAYQIGKYTLNGDRFWYESTTLAPPQSQRPEYMKNIWRNPGDQTDIPRYGENTIYSTRQIEDASFLRLKNLSLSYQMPQSVLQKTGFIKGVKISAVFRNLFTITKFTGYDPEFDGNIMYGMYPNTRQYTLGLELTF